MKESKKSNCISPFEICIIASTIVGYLTASEVAELKNNENLKEWNFLLFKEMLYPTINK
jgi:hypothetical protein